MRTIAGRLLLLLLPLLLARAVPARGGDESDLERRKEDLLLKLRTRRAIDRGAIWLADQQRPDGSFHLKGNTQGGPFPESRHEFGESALATLTLAHCGYDADRPVIKKAVAYLKKHYRSYLKGDYWPQASSYSLSLVVLALHELYAQEPDAAAGAGREPYGGAVQKAENPCRYPRWAQQMIRRILDWMLENRAKEGLFRYPGGLDTGGAPPGGMPPGMPPGAPPGMPGPPVAGPAHYGPEDMSNTQYVLLALWAGSRCGYPVDEEALVSIAERLLAVQEADGRKAVRVPDPPADAGGGAKPRDEVTQPGDMRDRERGFGYTPGAPPTGSMTTAGMSSLAIVKAMLLEQHGIDPTLAHRLDQGIWDSIAWLTGHFDVHGNPPDGGPVWHYYYLYGLERACVIVAKRYLGDHDWYREGAKMLVDAQQENGAWKPPSAVGAWNGGPGPVYDTSMLDTCFALLFLKRATLLPKTPLLPQPVVTPKETRPAEGK